MTPTMGIGKIFTTIRRSLIFSYFLAILPVVALIVNSTIDDSDPRVTYPRGSWVARSATLPCPGCAGAAIDPTQSFAGTWHEASDYAEAEFTFSGTGIEIFCTVRNMPGNQSNYTFLVDNRPSGDFVFIGQGGNIWNYNTSVFLRRNLPRGQHTMKIVEGTTSFMAFDWARIEDETPDPTTSPISSSSSSSISSRFTTSGSIGFPVTQSDTQPSSSGTEANTTTSPPIGAIVGAIAGGVVLLVLIGVLWWWFRKRRNNEGRSHSGGHSTPPPSQIIPHPYLPGGLDMAGGQGQMQQLPQGYSATPWAPSPPTKPQHRPPITTGYPYQAASAASQSQSSLGRSSQSPSNPRSAGPAPRGPHGSRSKASLLQPETPSASGYSSSQGRQSNVSSPQTNIETRLFVHQDGGQAPPEMGNIVQVEELPPAYANYGQR